MSPIRRNGVWLFVICALVALASAASGAEEEEAPPFDELLLPAIRPNMGEELEAALVTRATDGVSVAVRMSAILTLSLSHRATPEAIAAFTQALDDASADVRRTAVLALGAAGEAAAPAAQKLAGLAVSDEEDSDTRRNALAAILDLGDPAESAIAALEEAAGHWPPELALYPAAVLAKNGRDVAGNLEVIAGVLRDAPDAEERYWAAKALGVVGRPAGERAVDLIAALEDPHPEVRVAAATALGKTSPPDIAVPPLLELAMRKRTDTPTRPYLDTRGGAVKTLGMLGAEHPAAVDALFRVAEEGAPLPRGVAIVQLTDLPIDHQRLVPAIQEALTGTGLAGSALLAIPKVPDPPPHFVHLIEGGPPGELAVLALTSIDGQTDEVRDVLIGYARHVNPLVARFAIAELPKYATGGEATGEVVEVLTDQLQSSNTGLVIEAAKALGEIGPPAASALDELEPLADGTIDGSPIYDNLKREVAAAMAAIRAGGDQHGEL
jgi:HEAT repeat protein